MIELERCNGRFGVIRIFERKRDRARLYCIGAAVQTMTNIQGVSCLGYVHAIELMLRGMKRVLLLGGAGGSLASMLARRGCDVTVFDTDRAAEALTRRYFNLDTRVQWFALDALACMNALPRFDAVVVDASDGHGLPAAFRDAHALAALAARACPDGVLIVNLVAAVAAPAFIAQLRDNDLHVSAYRPDEIADGNMLLHIRRLEGPLPELDFSDVEKRPEEARAYLRALRVVDSANPN